MARLERLGRALIGRNSPLTVCVKSRAAQTRLRAAPARTRQRSSHFIYVPLLPPIDHGLSIVMGRHALVKGSVPPGRRSIGPGFFILPRHPQL
jgi:hypothetical protein